jgi:hypothetical protein
MGIADRVDTVRLPRRYPISALGKNLVCGVPGIYYDTITALSAPFLRPTHVIRKGLCHYEPRKHKGEDIHGGGHRIGESGV